MTAGGVNGVSPAASTAIIHVEVRIHPHSTADYREVERQVEDYLLNQPPLLLQTPNRQMFDYEHHHSFLRNNVESIRICECNSSRGATESAQIRLQIYPHQMNHEQAVDEVEPDENIVSFREWTLPTGEFGNLWDSLVYEENIPDKLLNYVQAAMIFSDRSVDQSLVSWNRVVLLHGPPGTGKTSLCKALAQKLSIRLCKRYDYGKLIEINAHSLFSKWFSESGKLVMRLFQHLTDIIADERAFVCLLIDEVESLAAVRQSSASEPSDSIRVVNAFLTQLDRLKGAKNLLVLTTSNICGSIDLAFVDRADIKQFIGLPGSKAIYSIYKSCLDELIRAGIVSTPAEYGWMDAQAVEMLASLDDGSAGKLQSDLAESDSIALRSSRDFSLYLWRIAQQSSGLSGRMLRKLPFLAFSATGYAQYPLQLCEFLRSLSRAVNCETEDRKKVKVANI